MGSNLLYGIQTLKCITFLHLYFEVFNKPFNDKFYVTITITQIADLVKQTYT